jgi:hypothetical protein
MFEKSLGRVRRSRFAVVATALGTVFIAGLRPGIRQVRARQDRDDQLRVRVPHASGGEGLHLRGLRKEVNGA